MSVRNWCFTIHSKHDGNIDALACHKDTRYLVYQEEVCPTSGREHIQGYIELVKAKRVAGMLKICPAHYEPRRGTRQQARDYCMKEESRAAGKTSVEVGEWTLTPGSRDDLTQVKDALDRGDTLTEVAHSHFATCARFSKWFKEYAALIGERRSWKTKVIVYWGQAGTGKSRRAAAEYPDAYYQDGTKWWSNYQAEDAVIIDDFDGDMPLNAFLRLTDRYPLQVETKGGYVNFVARTIVITSNLRPEEWYPDLTPERHAAVMRRLDEIKMLA